MNNQDILDALSEVDPALIRRAEQRMHNGAEKKKKRTRRMAALAACLACVIVAGAVIPRLKYGYWPVFGPVTPPVYQPSYEDGADGNPPPVVEGAYLQATEVKEIFPLMDGETNAYSKVYWSEDRPMTLTAIPETEYVRVYTADPTVKPLDSEEFSDFWYPISTSIFEAFGVKQSQWSYGATEERENYLGRFYEYDTYRLLFEQYAGQPYGPLLNHNTVVLYRVAPGNIPMVLNGQKLQINMLQTEEEIIGALRGVRDALFLIFDCTFDSAKVTYQYNSDSYEQALRSVTVTYYNAGEDRFSKSDSLELVFKTTYTAGGNLTDCLVRYTEQRVPTEEVYSAEALCRRLTLEEAEKMLEKGYVFGGHVCDCMKEQEKVSFDDYDFVGYEYVEGDTRLVPFYAFYKRIGKLKNGNVVYAKTLVCAIEVEGLEEYFEAQEKDHHISDFWDEVG